jgi:hypothetical protein
MMANDTKHSPPPIAVTQPPLLSGAEALALSAVAAPAATVVVAYSVDRAGLAFPPVSLLAVFLGAAAAALAVLRPRIEWRLDELTAWLAVVGAIFLWLLWIATPSFLPLGSGADLTHHLLLIQYIEAHWRLVHDPAVERFLGEMTGYTPGSHILVAAAGAWTGTDGLRALYPVLAATIALKGGFVFLVARRVIATMIAESSATARLVQLAFACLASALLFASHVYFLRSFVENSFVAQVVAELFAIVMWWSLVVWETGALSAVVFGAAGAATFLTWPIWIGPPLVLAGIIALTDREQSFVDRAKQLAVAVAPIVLVGVLYFAARPAGLAMAATTGAAPWPRASAYAGWFLALSGLGLGAAAMHRGTRIVTMFAGAILLQSAGLYLVAGPGAAEPYLALKMFYLLLYPQAVASAVVLTDVWKATTSLRLHQKAPVAIAVFLVLTVLAAVAWPLRRAPRSVTTLEHPSISAPLERAGLWARDHVPANCIEYLVDFDETAYWLHLAVLGNPRVTPRSLDPDTYKPDFAIARWLTPGGLTYGIADLATLPRGVSEELDVVQQFGTAAVVRQRGPSSCPSDQ